MRIRVCAHGFPSEWNLDFEYGLAVILHANVGIGNWSRNGSSIPAEIKIPQAVLEENAVFTNLVRFNKVSPFVLRKIAHEHV